MGAAERARAASGAGSRWTNRRRKDFDFVRAQVRQQGCLTTAKAQRSSSPRPFSPRLLLLYPLLLTLLFLCTHINYVLTLINDGSEGVRSCLRRRERVPGFCLPDFFRQLAMIVRARVGVTPHILFDADRLRLREGYPIGPTVGVL